MLGCEFIDTNGDDVSVIAAEDLVRVDIKVHSLSVIRRACYSLAADCWFWIRDDDDNHVVVEIARRQADSDLLLVRRRLGQALIDFGIRQRIEDASAEVRSVLISAALAEARGSRRAMSDEDQTP
ncbi:His-Xaa-Ser system protein HxsD [Oleomonas cavernae]|uniref:His-Xaa-Ser system protein HxsD n=1 Tax=Oleomonas cavernae TaxID=2320859 RepID=A0A418WH36_9PROT|nr:His-Xaa-Ser system protein HxsD [Oleomonas cavernae]RJF89343.1 His-Xaa-Ser system protein HxsD [Oleomonas cavernae]